MGEARQFLAKNACLTMAMLTYIIDGELSMDQHVRNVVCGFFYQLRQLQNVRRSLTIDAWPLDVLWLQPTLRLRLTIVSRSVRRIDTSHPPSVDGAKRYRLSGCWHRQVWPSHSGPSWCPSLAACASTNTVQGCTYCFWLCPRLRSSVLHGRLHSSGRHL